MTKTGDSQNSARDSPWPLKSWWKYPYTVSIHLQHIAILYIVHWLGLNSQAAQTFYVYTYYTSILYQQKQGYKPRTAQDHNKFPRAKSPTFFVRFQHESTSRFLFSNVWFFEAGQLHIEDWHLDTFWTFSAFSCKKNMAGCFCWMSKWVGPWKLGKFWVPNPKGLCFC